MSSPPNPKGFTLVELLIVVAIIAILAAIAVPNLVEARRRADASADAANLKAIASALALYRIDYGVYPLSDGRAGTDDTRDITVFGDGPAGNGYANGIPNILVALHYIENREALFSPALVRANPSRRENLRYAYNAAAADSGAFEGGNGTPIDGHGAGARAWVCRSLYINSYQFDRDRYLPFPFGEAANPSAGRWGSENVLWNDFSVTLEQGAAPF